MNRHSEYPIHPQFLNRWSPRSLTGESISDEQLFTLFEAARWAPSSYNDQPWRFLYAKRESSEWKQFLGLLVEFNQSWAHKSGALICVLSHKQFEQTQKPSITHSFDAGAAWMSLALQAHLLGFVAHAMQGFDYERARKELKVPETYQVEAMIAIGKQGDREALTEELKNREAPSLRKPLSSLVQEGIFKTPL